MQNNFIQFIITRTYDSFNSDLLIQTLEKHIWNRAEVLKDGVDKIDDSRTNKSYSIDCHEDLIGIKNWIHEECKEALKYYEQRFNLRASIFEDVCALRYEVGQEFKLHYDSGTGNTATRKLSAIFYVNDNYEGGELEFPLLDLKIKPRSATLVFFPSNFCFPHIAHPVTNGTKYALVTWLH